MNLVSSFVYGLTLLLGPAQADVGFSGVWERNVEQSDDPQEQMQEAMEAMRGQMGHRGGGGGGRRGGGRPPGKRGGRESGGRPEIGRIPDELSLDLANAELHVDDGEQLQIYYLDGDEHKREMSNGVQLETVAELIGNAIVIEEKTEHGAMDRRFELSLDDGTMVMTVSVKFGRMKEPVVIRTVYEKAAEKSSNE